MVENTLRTDGGKAMIQLYKNGALADKQEQSWWRDSPGSESTDSAEV